MWQLKGLVDPKVKMLSYFTHPSCYSYPVWLFIIFFVKHNILKLRKTMNDKLKFKKRKNTEQKHHTSITNVHFVFHEVIQVWYNMGE